MGIMKTLLTGFKVPKIDEGAKKAQLRQEQRANDAKRKETQELAGRDRLLAARKSGPQTLFSASRAGSSTSLGG